MKQNEEIIKILEEELEYWRGGTVKPKVEENIDDIIGIVKYETHGDQYLIVITNNGCFEYGYYENLKYNAYQNRYLRKPTKEIAGKIKYEDDMVYEADEFIVTVTKNGVIRKWSNGDVRCKLSRHDSWGDALYDISLKQFGYRES